MGRICSIYQLYTWDKIMRLLISHSSPSSYSMDSTIHLLALYILCHSALYLLVLFSDLLFMNCFNWDKTSQNRIKKHSKDFIPTMYHSLIIYSAVESTLTQSSLSSNLVDGLWKIMIFSFTKNVDISYSLWIFFSFYLMKQSLS